MMIVWIVLAVAGYLNLGLLLGAFSWRILKKPDKHWWKLLKILLWPISFLTHEKEPLVFCNSEKGYILTMLFAWPLKIAWLSLVWGIIVILCSIIGIYSVARAFIVLFLQTTTWPIRQIARINTIGQLRPFPSSK